MAARLDIEDAVAKLTPAAARVLSLLVDWEHGDLRARPQADVAEELGVEVATVASTLRDALRQLRQHLPNYLEGIA
jgi:DNA-directed RNA polymerase specialized sigma24 family protein